MSRLSLLLGSATASLLFAACAPIDANVFTSEAAQTAASWGASCGAAIDISSAVQSGASVHGTTAGSSTGLSTCGDRTGPTAYYRFDIPFGGGNFRVDVTSALPATDPSAASAAVVVRTGCDKFEDEIACNAQPSEKGTYVGYHVSGPVFIRVEGAWFSQGFDIKVTKLPFECKTDDDCSDWPDGSCNQLNGNCISHLQCRGTRGNCDGNWDNGCETDLAGDDGNCGACGTKCDASGAHASAAKCSNAVCELTCDSGFANCDGRSINGCEANLNTDGLTCGACGTSCGGGVCAGGTCASHGEEIAEVPGANATDAPFHDTTYNLQKIEVSKNRIIVQDDAYVGQVWSIPKAGGAPEFIDQDYDFAAAPTSSEVWGVSQRTVRRVSELGGEVAPEVKLSSPEDARKAATDGTTLFLFEETEPVSIRSLAPGADASSLLWTSTRSGQAVWTEPSVTASRVVARPAYMSGGSSYSGFAKTFVAIDRATGIASAIGDLPSYDVAYAADDTGVWYGDDAGLYFLPYAGGPAEKRVTALRVSSITTDATHVYFTAGDDCTYPLRAKSASRIFALPKAGGVAREIGYDHVGPKKVGNSGPCRARRGHYLAVDGPWLYWVSEDRVRRIAK